MKKRGRTLAEAVANASKPAGSSSPTAPRAADNKIVQHAAVAFEKNVAKMLARTLHGEDRSAPAMRLGAGARGGETVIFPQQVDADMPASTDDTTMDVIWMDKVYELAVKWQPPVRSVMAMVKALSDLVDLETVPLTNQVFFLQSLANLQKLKGDIGAAARDSLNDIMPLMGNNNVWVRGLACCLSRHFAKHLNESDPAAPALVSQLLATIKRTMHACADKRKFEAYRIICVASMHDLVRHWFAKLPADERAAATLFAEDVGSARMSGISDFLRWTIANGMQQFANTPAIWASLSEAEMFGFLDLCPRYLYDYRLQLVDAASTTFIIRGLLSPDAFETALNVPELLAEIISHILLILQPLPTMNEYDTATFELRYTLIRFLGKFCIAFRDEGAAAVAEAPAPLRAGDATVVIRSSFGNLSEGGDGSSGSGTALEPPVFVSDFAALFLDVCRGNPTPAEGELHRFVLTAYDRYLVELAVPESRRVRIVAPHFL